MTMGTLLLPAIAAILVFLLYMLGMQMVSKRETTVERIRRMTDASAPPEGEVVDPMRAEQELSPVGKALAAVLRITGANTEAFRKKSQMRFYRAGIESPDAPIFYLFFKRIGFIFFLGLAYIIASAETEGLEQLLRYMIALLILVLGLFGPQLMLTNQRKRREQVLQHSFPDALDLLLVCVEAGLALDGALARVCKELGRAHPVITKELNRTRLELTLLNDRSQALTNLAERTDMMAFRALTTALLQSEKFGTSLTDTLRVLSEDFRHARLMKAEEKAGRLPVLITIPLITLLIPALFIIILGPAIMSVIQAFSH